MYYQVGKDCQINNLSDIYEQYFGRRNNGYFVEVGAYDGQTYSNTSFLADIGWEGVYAEPIVEFADKCLARHLYNNVCIFPGAVGDEHKMIEITKQDDISTALNNSEELYRKIGNKDLLDKLRDEKRLVPQITLDLLLKSYSVHKYFDLLVLDTESTEYDILKNFPIDEWSPKLVIIEMHEEDEGWNKSEFIRKQNELLNEYFSKYSYKKIYKDNINTIFSL